MEQSKAQTRSRRFLRAAWKRLRNAVLLALVLSAVVGFKAWQNRRDVVPVPPLESAAVVRPGSGFRVMDPYAVEGRWYKVQLHMHTDRSIDGRWSPEEALAAYEAAGYDFVAISDHDRVTRPEAVPDGILVVPAEENTVVFPFWPLGQHAIHLFAEDHVPRGGAAARFAAMTAGGGIVSVAHPNWPGNLGTGRWAMEHLLATPHFRLMEVYNPHSNADRDTALWHELAVRRGPNNPVWAVAVDDAHDLELFNAGWTMVRAREHSLAALREALERGSLYATTGPVVHFFVADGPVIVVDEGGGDGADGPADAVGVGGEEVYDVSFIAASGDVVGRHQGPLPAFYEPAGTEGFVRVEVSASATGRRAWSQPFWIVSDREEL